MKRLDDFFDKQENEESDNDPVEGNNQSQRLNFHSQRQDEENLTNDSNHLNHQEPSSQQHHTSRIRQNSSSSVSKPKKNYSEADIPSSDRDLFSLLDQLIINKEGHEITSYEMHCVETLHKGKKDLRWKLKCTLCGKTFRKIDYFIRHRGDKCPLFKQNSLMSFFSSPNEPPPSPKQLLLEQLAIVSSSCNISSRQIASPEFKSFITFLLSTPTIKPFHVTYNDKSVTDSILMIYDRIKRASIQSLIASKLPAFIQIDGGQNGSLHTYQLLLCNPGNIPPFPFKSIEDIHWNSNEFASNIRMCILELINQGIIVAGITGDNEKSQLSGLDPCSKKSFQFLEKAQSTNFNRDLVSILYFPCLAHTTDLALDDAIDQETFEPINRAKTDLAMFHHFFMDSEVRRTIGRYRLSICEKQWIFLIKPSISLLKKVDLIKKFQLLASEDLKGKYPHANIDSLKNIFRVTNFLLPLNNYVEFLEKDDTCLWQVEPAFRSLLFELKARGVEYDLRDEAVLLVNCLKHRNYVTAKRELIVTAFFLTPDGYYRIQKWENDEEENEQTNEQFHYDRFELPHAFQTESLDTIDESSEDESNNIAFNINNIPERSIYFNSTEQSQSIANDKWSQVKLIQTRNIEKLITLFEEVFSVINEVSFDVTKTYSVWNAVFSLFLARLHSIIDFFVFLFRTDVNLCQGICHSEESEADKHDVIQEVLDNIDHLREMVDSNFGSDFFSQIIPLFSKCSEILRKLIDEITCLELSFLNNLETLNRFNMDDEVILLNEDLERKVNGLVNLKDTLITVFNDIITMTQSPASSNFLWPNVSAINSSVSSEVIAHYVVRTLGEYQQMDKDNLERAFKEWKPGQTGDVIEKELFQMYRFQPVNYWMKMSQYPQWSELAKIALRIISIPPTEAACERVFSARREIVTKHVSTIRDSVVEARAHLKSGLNRIQKKEE